MPRVYRILISPLARTDIERIGAYIAIDAPDRAEAFVEAMLLRISGLATLPERFPEAIESPLQRRRLRQMTVGLYRVIYGVARAEVTVFRVRHAARSPLRSLED